jgi:hypothetical protein
MVTGSVAAMIYGEPRLTHDIDLVVVLPDSAIDALVAAFPDAEFYCAPREVILVEAHRRRRGHFNIIHHESGFKADVYVAGTDALHRWAFSQRRELPFSATTMHVAPPEYVILRKLEYFREGGSEKHVGDVRGILRHQGGIDVAFIEGEVEQRGLRREWDAVRAES